MATPRDKLRSIMDAKAGPEPHQAKTREQDILKSVKEKMVQAAHDLALEMKKEYTERLAPMLNDIREEFEAEMQKASNLSASSVVKTTAALLSQHFNEMDLKLTRATEDLSSKAETKDKGKEKEEKLSEEPAQPGGYQFRQLTESPGLHRARMAATPMRSTRRGTKRKRNIIPDSSDEAKNKHPMVGPSPDSSDDTDSGIPARPSPRRHEEVHEPVHEQLTPSRRPRGSQNDSKRGRTRGRSESVFSSSIQTRSCTRSRSRPRGLASTVASSAPILRSAIAEEADGDDARFYPSGRSSRSKVRVPSSYNDAEYYDSLNIKPFRRS
ncbi:Uu.00g027950.m01.CDS01 [Anthostomella pinea]|uniref:Uu.00g027950.m01.CDS01 n=1 Tax=Anthostomella pinea TaxID=933095 RepID=A0AAI8V8B9_9PEZI|nr:Uu.00g027950.m01.CDS01 [Anthostomella pinea]